jgi:DNA-binding transcriptional regulator YiaG
MKTCTSCRSKNLGPALVSIDRTWDGVKVVVREVPVTRCGDCGDWTIGLEAAQRHERVTALRAIGAGVRSGSFLKWARKVAGVRAGELGELLGVSAETVSRWENGHREAEPAVWNALADLVRDALNGSTETRDRLRGIGAAPTGRAVRVVRASFGDGTHA